MAILQKQAFLNLLNDPGQIVNIKGTTFSAQLEVNARDFECWGVVFQDCVFQNDLIFRNVDFRAGLLFRNCRFKKSLDLRKCSAAENSVEIDQNSSNITLNDCELHQFICAETCKFNLGIAVLNNCQINNFYVKGLKVPNGQLSIRNSLIKNDFDLKNIDIKSSIRLHECDINAQVRIESCKASSYSITKSTFEKDLYIWAGLTNDIVLNENTFENDFKIQSTSCSGSFNIYRSEFKTALIIDYFDETNKTSGGPTNFHIEAVNANKILVNGSANVNEPYSIKNLKIRTSLSLQGQFHFSNLMIQQLDLKGVNRNADIHFDYCRFQRINIHQFINYGNLHFQNIRSIQMEDSSLLIQNSNLGKAHFFNTFLNEFEKVNIYDTILTNIVTSRVRWFSQINRVDGNGVPDWNQIRDVFRQLKLSMERQSDRVQSLIFKREEMNALYEYLKLSKSIFNGDRIIMCLNRSNNYGLNWLKPIGLIFLTSLLFYCLIIVSISGNLTFYPSLRIVNITSTYSELIAHLSAFPQLLNPAHSLDRIFKNYDSFSFWTHFIDFIYRLVFAYLGVQTISAFRKYLR